MNQPTFRPLDRTASVTTAFLAAQCGIALLGFVPESTWTKLGEDLGAQSDLAAIAVTLVFGLGALGALITVVIGTIISFLMWMNRAAWNVRTLLPGATFEFTPGWCVGWWFVPLANLIKPAHAMSEIAKASAAAAMRDRNDPYVSSWMTASTPTIVGTWWAAWVISNLFERIGSRSGDIYIVSVLSSIFSIVAAVLCILMIREVTAAQRDAHARQATDVRFAAGIAHVAQ